jgi:hypothetical protein
MRRFVEAVHDYHYRVSGEESNLIVECATALLSEGGAA